MPCRRFASIALRNVPRAGATRGRGVTARWLVLALVSAATGRLSPADKNGVSPQAISLPTGPGSIQGLGESFQPQLNTGSGSYSVKLEVPKGTGGHQPSLTLSYNTGSSNGCLGLGWSLSGLSAVSRSTDEGVPRYVDGPNSKDDDLDGVLDNPQELDQFAGMDQEELVQLDDGSFRSENESSFLRYVRVGAGWEARSKDGTVYEFGKTAAARIEDTGRVFKWLIERVTDLDGNSIEYSYVADASSPGQKYCRVIRWGQPAAFFAAVLSYEGPRPDVIVDYRAAFEVRTALRLVRIDIMSQGIAAASGSVTGDLNGDGTPDALVRRYTLEYHGDAHLSLLKRVTKFGRDGVTALPPVSFEYNRWTPPNNVAATVIHEGDVSPEGLNSPSVELIDMNGDGLPDLLSTTASQHRVQINQGQAGNKLIFGAAQPVQNAPSVDIKSGETHLADSTADGAADLMVRVATDRFFCFDNTSKLSWTSQAIPLRHTDTWPLWPFDGAEGVNSRTFDLDHNRANDILHTSASGLQVWMLSRTGQYTKELRTAPLLCEGQMFRFEIPGSHVADINSDRLQDAVWVQPSRVIYWPNKGRGVFGQEIIFDLEFTFLSTDLAKVGFSDVDGDGLVDLTVVRPSSFTQDVLYWLNRFQKGFEGPYRVSGLPAQNGSDALRWADMNGNGSTDIVISNSTRLAGQKLQVIDLVPGVRPYLLTHVENGLGLSMDMEYESSVEQMVRATTPWTFTMPMPVPVLARISEDDGRGTVNTRAITYRDPFYNAPKQEFRGFRQAELRDLGDDSIETQATVHFFDTGDAADCLKGKLLASVVTDESGAVFQRSDNDWTHRVLATGVDGREVCYSFSEAVDQLIVEAGDSPVRLRSEMAYDDFGNQIEERNHGVLATAGDEVFTARQFELRPAVWLMGLLTRETVRDGAGTIASDTFSQYDARGHLSRLEKWLDTENRNIVEARHSYDAFGNLVETLDANGHRRTIAYDPLIHVYATLERIHLDGRTLDMTADYDLALGTVLHAVDFSGAEHLAEFDALGRVVRMALDGGAERTFSYHLASPVSFYNEQALETPNGEVRKSFTYFDAYGRKLGTKSEAEGGKWRLTEAVRFNSRKLPSRQWLPLETETEEYAEPAESERHDRMSYDAMARPVGTLHPDGTAARFEYEPLASRVFDENDTPARSRPKTLKRDGLGRIREVVERNGAETYTSRYTWNTLGDVVELIDARNNRKALEYDSLRRRTAMHDPDRGTTRYTYDDFGNLLRTVDAKGQENVYAYDFANRLAREARTPVAGQGSTVVTYRYDVPSVDLDFGNGERGSAEFTAGHLAAVIDPTGETHFSYDARGNKAWTLKRIREPRTGLVVGYWTRFAYDLLNRMTEVVYPDEDRVRYFYNEEGGVERVDGGAQGAVLVKNMDSHPSGQIERVEFGNDVVSAAAYDLRDRIASQITQGPGGLALIDNEYRYDPVSNLTHQIDRRPFALVDRGSPRRNSQLFSYDDLHRLTQVRYAHFDDLNANLGQIDFGFDAIGNLVQKGTPPAGQPGHLSGPTLNLGTLAYGGGQSSGRGPRALGDPAGPHAVTSSTSGRAFSYDANGNMSRRDGATLLWDAKDQFVGMRKPGVAADYLFDYSDRRVAKSVTQGLRGEETIYVNQYFEERPGHAPAKYVFSGSVRIARVEGMLDPARERLQRLRLKQGWNAVAIAIETPKTLGQVFGADAAVYTFSNGNYQALALTSQARTGPPLWVHVPTTRLALAKGKDVPLATSAAIPSGGALVAWSQIEPLLPAAHISAPARVFVHDAPSGRWLLSDPSLPGFLQDSASALPTATSMWIDAAVGTTLKPEARSHQAIVTYHLDHLGSSSVTTDRQGALVEEIAYYPFGEVRNRHTPSAATTLATDHDFTGKETDDESGFVDHGARFYEPTIGRFLSVDPLASEPARLDGQALEELLSNPQKQGLYSYVLNNPVRYADPDGLEEEPRGPTTKVWKMEIAALSRANSPGVPSRVAREESVISVFQRNAAGIGSWRNVDVPPGKRVDEVAPRSGWRRVTSEFRIKDPDGKPVAGRFFTVVISRKDENGPKESGQAYGLTRYTGRTDENGVLKLRTNIPRSGGEIQILGTFDNGGEIQTTTSSVRNRDFKRSSGQYELGFDVNLKSTDATKEQLDNGADGAAAEIKQTQ